MLNREVRLGLNIDHVATLRNARGGNHPNLVHAAQLAKDSRDVDGITVHLREDRRHIDDDDVYAIKKFIDLPLNLEMAATQEMQAIALEVMPNACCIVPERREELTTEGGLDIVSIRRSLRSYLRPLKAEGIRISLFLDPEDAQIDTAYNLGVDIVELHTGRYANSTGEQQQKELLRLQRGAKLLHSMGIEVHAGHGLTFDNVQPIAAIPQVKELNIGHYIVGEALFVGLPHALRVMRKLIDGARS